MPSQFDKEKTRKKIGLMLEKIKTEVDPHLLNEYRSLFKKEVSFFRRSWVAAYLLMLSEQGNVGRFDKNRPAGNFNRDSGGSSRSRSPEGRQSASSSGNSRPEYSRTEPRTDSSRTEVPRKPLPEEESRRLFISIGRNRRVFPREILGLITTKTAVSRDDIGAIRILDNYSFVQVRDSVADTIIEALNGKPFRGRTLSVNYARVRKDDSAENRNEDSFIADENGADSIRHSGESADRTWDDTAADTAEYEEAGDIIEDEAKNENIGSLDQKDDQPDEEGV
jgi:hypothetical protein